MEAKTKDLATNLKAKDYQIMRIQGQMADVGSQIGESDNLKEANA